MEYNLGTAHGRIDIDNNGLMGAEVGLRQTGFALAAVGTAMVGAVGMVINTSAEFEKSMSAISAITGETGTNIDLLREKALELGKEGPYGPNQVATAFIELAKAGLTTKEVLDGVGEATIALAAAGDLALDRSAEIMANTIRTFQLTADDAGHVADVLAGAANASTTDVEDLAVSLKYAGSVANAVGVSFEDVSAALVILGNSGIKGSTAGTTLRRILLNLQPASKAASKQMEELGIITADGANKFFTAEGKAKSLAEIVQILKDSTAGLSDAQKIQAINTIFGARASAGALILLRDGAEGLNKAQEAINRTSAQEVQEKRLDNLAGSLTKLKAALEAVFIEAGSPFQDVLKGIVDGLRQLTLWFGEIPKPVAVVILGFTAVVGVLSLLGGMLFLTLAPILQLIRLFALLPESLALVKAAFSGITAVVRGFTLSLLTNPVFLIIAAIVALGIALVILYQKWEPFHEFIDNLWQSIQSIWDTILEFFQNLPDLLGEAFERFKTKLGETFQWLKDHWADVLLFLVAPPVAIGKAIIDNFDTIKEKVGEAKDKVVDFVEEVGPKAVEKVETFTATVSDGMTTMSDDVSVATDISKGKIEDWGTTTSLTASTEMTKFIDNVKFAMTQLPYFLGYYLGLAIGTTLRSLQFMASIAWEKAQEFLFNLSFWFAQLPEKVWEWMKQTLDTLIFFFPMLVQTGIDGAKNLLWGVAIWLAQLPGKVVEAVQGMIWNLAAKMPELINAAVEVAKSMVFAMGGYVLLIPGMIRDVFSSIAGKIREWASGAATAAKNFAKGIWDGIKDGLGIHSPSYIEVAFDNIEENVKKSIANLYDSVGGLKSLNGLTSSLNITSASPVALAGVNQVNAVASAGAGVNSGITVMGPLVEIAEANIRSDQDITTLSRGLALRMSEEQLALGKKVLP